MSYLYVGWLLNILSMLTILIGYHFECSSVVYLGVVLLAIGIVSQGVFFVNYTPYNL